MIAQLVLLAALQATPVPSPSAPPAPPTPSASAPAVTPVPSPSGSPAAGLSAQPAAINLHPGQQLSVVITGANGAIAAAIDVPAATATVDQARHAIAVTASATQTGTATMTVTDASGASIQIPIRVAFDAGAVPANLTVRVTGDAIDPQWLQKQIQKAVLGAVQPAPGAAAQLGAFQLPSLIDPGSTAQIPVPVQIPGGEQYFDVNAVTSVSLEDVAEAPFLPQLLFYDDDPEKVLADGLLYQNQVSADRPALLYYYHQNALQPRRLAVVLSVPPNDPATVQLVDASAGPNPDVMSVGHAVSRDFLQEEPHDEGTIVDVGDPGPYLADLFDMQPQDGAAGSVGVRVLSGGPVTVAVVAVPQGVTDAQLASYVNQPRMPGDGHHRTGVFTLTGYGDETLAYTVGGQDAETQYGATTPPAADGAGRDYGDYGVLRKITFDVTNPGPGAATAYLYEEPMGGAVRSSFLVDGALVQVGCARVSQRYQIGVPLSVPAGSSQVVVQTMTDGGSNYPLAVGITTTPPAPQTPPITAPDGCFPKPQQPEPSSSPAVQATPEASPEPSPSPK